MLQESHLTAIRVVIIGKVQGVWFRNWTVSEAKKRKLDGWVRNCNDGNVEALFSGCSRLVGEMIEACYVGPPMASVATIKKYKEEELRLGSGFSKLNN